MEWPALTGSIIFRLTCRFGARAFCPKKSLAKVSTIAPDRWRTKVSILDLDVPVFDLLVFHFRGFPAILLKHAKRPFQQRSFTLMDHRRHSVFAFKHLPVTDAHRTG